MKIGLLGFGTVGQGVWRLLEQRRQAIEAACGQPVEIARIGVRNKTKPRDTAAPAALFTESAEEIVNDPAIGLVIEVTGDKQNGWQYMRTALQNGKHLITANKAVVAEHYTELVQLANKHGVRFLLEACVAGGVPLVAPLQARLALEEFVEMRGILNGSCNYILTRMSEQNGLTFEEASREARRLGYLEEDPSDDVDGHDTRRKLSILCQMGFGLPILPQDIPCHGIRQISPQDIALLAGRGMVPKLIGRAWRQVPGGGYAALVMPCAVPLTSMFSMVPDAVNLVSFKSADTGVGELRFYGPGAGMMPTADEVLADVCEALQAPGKKIYQPAESPRPNGVSQLRSNYYIRGEAAHLLPGEWRREILQREPLALLTKEIPYHLLQTLLQQNPDGAILRIDNDLNGGYTGV